MSEKIKLTKEELDLLKSYQEKQTQFTFELGSVDIQRAFLEGQRSAILENFANLQEESNKTAISLQEKYGEGDIDLKTGEFTLVK